MEKHSRRRFLATTGTGAAAVSAATLLPASLAEAQAPSAQADSLRTAEAEIDASLADTVMVACVTDVAGGEVTVINGDEEISVTDHALARHIAQVTRKRA